MIWAVYCVGFDGVTRQRLRIQFIECGFGIVRKGKEYIEAAEVGQFNQKKSHAASRLAVDSSLAAIRYIQILCDAITRI